MDVTPVDWPKDGLIDLTIHDLPHVSSDLEWWYYNAHFTTQENLEFGFFACFFISKMNDSATRYCYSVLWSLTDITNKKYYFSSNIDKESPKICLDKLKTDFFDPSDIYVKQALEESFNKNKIPFLDKIMEEDVLISHDSLKLQIQDILLEKLSNGNYHLSLQNEDIQCDLIFEPQKKPVRQGNNGIISGPNSEKMFYYFIPRCEVKGSIYCNQSRQQVTRGQGWFDHEFGIVNKNPAKIAWTWASIQLENGYDISLYSIHDFETKKLKNLFCTIIDPEGEQQFFSSALFKNHGSWKSYDTFNEYHTQWTLTVAEADLDITISVDFPKQECITVLAHPGFWEGSCKVTGMHQNKYIQGKAYIEQNNLKSIKKIDEFFASISEEVTNEINKILPLDPDEEKICELISSTKNLDLMDGIDRNQYIKTLISPIRTLCDRGGKRWRSYVLVAACQLAGGDFTNHKNWLAVPDLMHTASLIIDDVQDKSLIRRGGPACHILFGEPHAINCGTAAYGLFHVILKQSNLSLVDCCRIYDLYFDTYRAAHAGQAIDIDGHLEAMAAALENKDFNHLTKRVLAGHRLKSGIPFASAARMGAILGKGSDKLIDALGQFFESIGIVFQIVDDILNLTGFKNNLKTVGEDIKNGKVTYPIAKSLELLPIHEKIQVWEILVAKTSDTNLHQKLIKLFENQGVFEACYLESQRIIESAWSKLDPLLTESYTKLMLRAFTWHLINRHY